MNCEMSESFRLAAVLAVIGGFLESYSFLLHGHVFANAQTGNMALCGMALATRDMLGAAKYALPVIAFASGVMLVDWVRSKWGQASLFHWRQGIVAVEAGLLCGCFFLKSGTHDALANLIVSIVCALQVQTFRKVHGTSYVSTMCTGNLRSASIACMTWWRLRDAEAKRQAQYYLGIIALFMTGAAVAVPTIGCFHERSVVLPIILLMCAVTMMRSSARRVVCGGEASDQSSVSDAECD